MTVDWLVESYPKVAEGTACAEVQRQRMWPAWWQARRPPCQGQELTVVMTAGTAQRWSPGPCWVCSSLLTQLASCRSWRGHFPDHWLLSPLGLAHRETFNIPGQIPAFPSGTEKPHRSKAGTQSPSTPPHTVSCLDGQTTPRTDCHPL